MKAHEVGLLFILAALWGASFLFMRIAAPILQPFPLVTIRVFLAGFFLLAILLQTRQSLHWREHRWDYVVVGLLQNALPFALIATAQLKLTASMAAMLNATTPLFTAVVAAIWLGHRLTSRKIIGIVCGLVGVGMLVGWQPEPLRGTDLLYAGASLAAALCYGLAAVYSKLHFRNIAPLPIVVGQLFSAGAWTLIPAFLLPPTGEPTTKVIYSMVGLSIFCTAIAYLIYFHLIATTGPTSAASVTFLVPFFSSLWGAIFLNETVSIGQGVGFVIILSGLWLVTGFQFGRMKPA